MFCEEVSENTKFDDFSALRETEPKMSPKSRSRPTTPKTPRKPASPRNLTNEFNYYNQDVTQVQKKENSVPEIKIIYQGRDILDFNTNITSDWPFRPSRHPAAENVWSFSEIDRNITALRRKYDKKLYHYQMERM